MPDAEAVKKHRTAGATATAATAPAQEGAQAGRRAGWPMIVRRLAKMPPWRNSGRRAVLKPP